MNDIVAPETKPGTGTGTAGDLRARAVARYGQATAASFVVLYGGAYGFAVFLLWWQGRDYPPFPTGRIWLGIRLLPALFLVPRLVFGMRALQGSRVAVLAHGVWGVLLLASFVAALAPAWLPFALLALAAFAAGTARDVVGLRRIGSLTRAPALGRLAIAWAVHDVAWVLAGRAVFVEASAAAAWPVLTALVLGLVTVRAWRRARDAPRAEAEPV